MTHRHGWLPPDVKNRLASLERWLLPGECLLCRQSLGDHATVSLVCALCRFRWIRLPDPQCARCGEPRLLSELACRLCQEWPPDLSVARSAVWHEGSARDVVHQLKYEGWWRVTEVMADAMMGLDPLFDRPSLVPVPLAPRRMRVRGYNQSEHLAQALGKRMGLPVRIDCLKRVRETPTQTALTPEERLANVAGAFQAERNRVERIVLVDDVFTTGATLIAAAHALVQAGAKQVGAVTFARAKNRL
ncbi:MAG: ComF family protein [Gemmatimonadota bacterium]